MLISQAKKLQKAMELMGTTPKNTLFLGDQIFTDMGELIEQECKQ